MPADPKIAAYAWSRFRRIMAWAMAVEAALMVVALRLALRHAGPLAIRRYVLAALAVGLIMLVSTAVMAWRVLVRARAVSGASSGNPPPDCRRSDVPE